MSPIRMHQRVTWSAETPVGSRARAMRMPRGRKNRRSTHSSTAAPLWERSFGGFTEHVLHDREGGHRFVFLDDERGMVPDLRVVDQGEHAVVGQVIEDLARVLVFVSV